MPSAAHQIAELYEAGGWTAVQGAVDEGRTESLHLDFKLKHNPSVGAFDKDDRKNLSEALSGFANSEGGVILWGVGTRRQGDGDRAAEVKPILDLRRFMSDLAQLTPEMVSPAVMGVRHVPILAPGETNAGIALTLIPQSDLTPHMARGPSMQRYYRRTGDTFRPLEHYEVADLFGRRAHPVMDAGFTWGVQIYTKLGGRGEAYLTISLVVRNQGRGLARYPALTLGQPGNFSVANWSGRYGGHLHFPLIPAPAGGWLRYAAGADLVIYPGDEVSVGFVSFSISSRQQEVTDFTMPYRIFAAEAQPLDWRFHISRRELLERLAMLFRTEGIQFDAAILAANRVDAADWEKALLWHP